MPTNLNPMILSAALAVVALCAAACGQNAGPASPPASYHRVSVTDFGAVAGDGKDDTAAVARAIQACVKRPKSALIFPKGRYDFFSRSRPPKEWCQLQVDGARGLFVDGQGSKLIFHGKTGCFMVRDSEDVTFSNFTIDWDEPLFSAGITTRADPRSFDVELSREYTGEGSEKIESIIEWDPKTLLPLVGGRDIYDLSKYEKKWITRTEKIGPKTLRFHLARDRLMTQGAHVVIRHQSYVYNAWMIWDSKRATIQDVTIHYAPGMGITAQRTEDVTLRRVRMAPPEGSGRALSIASDGTNFWDCRGTVRIEDCYFKATGDDVSNIHGFYLEVLKRVDERTVEVKGQHSWLWPPAVGHEVEFSHPRTLLTYATRKVSATERIKPRGHFRITFAKPLPDDMGVGHYLANATAVPKVRISGNHVVGNRSKGFLIRARDVIVENNVFEHVSGVGLAASVECNHWREGIGTRNVIFRNNKFYECNNGPNRAWGVIAVFSLTGGKGWRHGSAGVHQDLRIEGNLIKGTDNCGIYVASADGVVLRGNTIIDCSRKPSRMGGRNAIHLAQCRNVSIEDCKVIDPGPGLREALGFGTGVDKSSLRTKGNEGL